jgi:hypothetical protein
MVGAGSEGKLAFDPEVPSPARIYDYLLGGKDNYPADREAAQELLVAIPDLRTFARQNRAFLRRVVHYLAAEAGIRQFIDIGTGLPSQGNVHEIAQSVAPGAHVVCADNDPVVVRVRAVHHAGGAEMRAQLPGGGLAEQRAHRGRPGERVAHRHRHRGRRGRLRHRFHRRGQPHREPGHAVCRRGHRGGHEGGGNDRPGQHGAHYLILGVNLGETPGPEDRAGRTARPRQPPPTTVAAHLP